MHKVTGIGGFFFRAKDPDAIARWYHENLGVDPVPTAYGDPSWTQQAGETVFTAMPEALDQFGSPDRVWAINFRVDPEVYPNGRFASLADPEGNPIQLWEPSGE